MVIHLTILSIPNIPSHGESKRLIFPNDGHLSPPKNVILSAKSNLSFSLTAIPIDWIFLLSPEIMLFSLYGLTWITRENVGFANPFSSETITVQLRFFDEITLPLISYSERVEIISHDFSSVSLILGSRILSTFSISFDNDLEKSEIIS